MYDKAKPRVIEGRKVTVLLRILNLSSNVLLELVLIEGWTAELYSLEYTRQFFVWVKDDEAKRCLWADFKLN